jgi:hypothetical protein
MSHSVDFWGVDVTSSGLGTGWREKKRTPTEVDVLFLVEPRRFELLTSALQRQRSTN